MLSKTCHHVITMHSLLHLVLVIPLTNRDRHKCQPWNFVVRALDSNSHFDDTNCEHMKLYFWCNWPGAMVDNDFMRLVFGDRNMVDLGRNLSSLDGFVAQSGNARWTAVWWGSVDMIICRVFADVLVEWVSGHCEGMWWCTCWSRKVIIANHE